MKIKIKNNIENKRKTKLLGELGERLAFEQLRKNGFKNVRNLNDTKKNYEFADLIAERGEKTFVISVKTRQKFERLGGLNARYNLGNNWKENSKYVAKVLHAIPAWIAVQVDGPKYSIYFGLVSLIEENNGIPMQPEALKYYECLAKDEKLGHSVNSIKPSYEVIVTGNLDDRYYAQ